MKPVLPPIRLGIKGCGQKTSNMSTVTSPVALFICKICSVTQHMSKYLADKRLQFFRRRTPDGRARPGNGLHISNGAPRGMSACGWRRPLSLRRSAPCVLRWKTLARFLSSAPCRVRIPALGKKKARHRIGNGLQISNGAPSGIRTRDIHLERVASLAARRWGQRERV